MQKGTSYPDNLYCSFLCRKSCGSSTGVSVPLGQERDDLQAWYMETALPTEHFPGSHTCSFPLLFICFSSWLVFLQKYHWFWDRGFIFLSHFWVCWVLLFFYLIPQEALCFPSSCFCCTVARDFLSPELAVRFLRDGIIPGPWLQTWAVLGASGARGFSRSVGSWGEKLLKSLMAFKNFLSIVSQC